MNYIYKTVAVSSNLQVGKKGSTKDVSDHYDKLLNNHANEGWEYVNVITTTTTIPAGCLGGLFGSPARTISSNMIVFRKQG